MKLLVFDTEANGLLKEATLAWCISLYDMSAKVMKTLSFDDLDPENIISNFSGYDKIICHNQINYDLRLYKKLFGVDLEKILGRDAIIDTYVWSKALYPDRPMPEGCPSIVSNKELKISRRIGPHGLHAWAYRFGRRKIQIDDWRTYTDDMIARCEEDVKINVMTFKSLMKEANLKYEDL